MPRNVLRLALAMGLATACGLPGATASAAARHAHPATAGARLSRGRSFTAVGAAASVPSVPVSHSPVVSQPHTTTTSVTSTLDPSLQAPSGPGLSPLALTLSGPTVYASSTAVPIATPKAARATKKARATRKAAKVRAAAQTSNGVSPSAPIALSDALAAAIPGTIIHLAPGTYSRIKDTTAHAGLVTISGAGDATPPIIDGADLQGAQNLQFVNVQFSSRVMITHGPYGHETQKATNIGLIDDAFDCGSSAVEQHDGAIMVRGQSHNVTISGDYIHNCTAGIGSIAQDAQSTGVTITHNLLENLSGDGIDLGGLAQVTIANNVIRNIADPNGNYHNDAIQFFGNTTGVQIVHNVLANSRAQLLFIQDAVKSYATGSAVNSDILVEGNLIYGAGGVAVQAQGALNTRFIDNTIWSARLGGLLLRQSGYTGITPADTVLVGNVIQGMGRDAKLVPAIKDYNIIDNPGKSKSQDTSSDLHNVDPVFANAAAGDFVPTAQSPLYDAAAAVTAPDPGVLDTATDLFGTGVPGQAAYGAEQASDPQISYGAPQYGSAAYTG